MLKVIVVEDALLVRKGLILTTPWDQNQCEVVGEASNGLDGRKLLLELKPDIAITDIRLPGMSGLEMIESVRNAVHTKFIVISGFSEFEYARKAIQLGIIEYLVKPVSDSALSDALAKAGNAVWADGIMERLRSGDAEDGRQISLFGEYLMYASNPKSEYTNRAVQFIHSNYSRDVTAKDIAGAVALSESRLSHIFKEETSYTLGDYLAWYRMQMACRLLSDPMVRVSEAAERVGYRDQRYFSVVFRKIVGMTPTEFRGAGKC